GLGNEHPLENGFAFLWPYGLPYLPGSGVKGVLRQAVRELAGGAWGETHGWSHEKRFQVGLGNDRKTLHLSMIDLLFGLESRDGSQEHFRGVLNFWDVIPEIRGQHLMVEVMTGHQSHYYMNGQPPHDSGQPNPVYFLTVPPGTGFTFHVVCDRPFLQRIAPELVENDRWKALLQRAFEHAFEWLGFGAKTAVGYGAMQVDENAARERQSMIERVRKEAEERRRQEAERRKKEEALQQMPPIQREVEGIETVAQAIQALESGRWGEHSREAASYIKQRMQRENAWVEVSKKKKPEKDKKYQRTCIVKKYLES
ncbi:type III-B CRISPR module RAMP protein Cmr6, partial [Candidatus Parcubacteria bacterium]